MCVVCVCEWVSGWVGGWVGGWVIFLRGSLMWKEKTGLRDHKIEAAQESTTEHRERRSEETRQERREHTRGRDVFVAPLPCVLLTCAA